MVNAAGTRLGPYEILSAVGAGGMGEVYLARDTRLNRPVAIKFLSAEMADAASLGRFQQEAQTASSLNHPHILTVFDAGELDGRQYLVTEFIDGGTLKEWARAENTHVAADRRAARRCRRRPGRGAQPPASCTEISSRKTFW